VSAQIAMLYISFSGSNITQYTCGNLQGYHQLAEALAVYEDRCSLRSYRLSILVHRQICLYTLEQEVPPFRYSHLVDLDPRGNLAD
jgi:hypothetical protein